MFVNQEIFEESHAIDAETIGSLVHLHRDRSRAHILVNGPSLCMRQSRELGGTSDSAKVQMQSILLFGLLVVVVFIIWAWISE